MTSVSVPAAHFFGTRVGSWRIGAFELSESVYEPNATLQLHAHARAYLGLVVRGGHRETAGARERSCGPATVVFHPAAESHSNRFCADGGRIFRLEMDDEWLARLRDCGLRLDGAAESHRGPLSQIAYRMLAEFRARDSVSSLMIEGLALEFATLLARSRLGPTGGRLRDVVEYLRARLADEIRLEDVARVAGVHSAHLSRIFRAHHGCSVGEYIRRLRVDLAARELAASRKPIADIAATTGFADQSHFSRVFARLTGMTPGRYRKLHGRHR